MAAGNTKPLTGFDIFFDAMMEILSENGLPTDVPLEKVLEAFDTLGSEMKMRIDTMAATGYKVLPRPVVEHLRRHFTFSPNTPQQSADAIQNTTSSQLALTNQTATAVTSSDDDATTRNRSAAVNDMLESASTSSPVVCSSGCLNSSVFGQEHFAVIKHPVIQHVYLKISLEILNQIDVPPTAVPLIYDQLSATDLRVNGQALSTSLTQATQGPRMALLVTSLGSVETVMSELIRVVKGVMFIYDIVTKTWKKLWG